MLNVGELPPALLAFELGITNGQFFWHDVPNLTTEDKEQTFVLSGVYLTPLTQAERDAW